VVPTVRETIGGLPVMGLDKPRSEVAGPFRPHKWLPDHLRWQTAAIDLLSVTCTTFVFKPKPK